MGAIQADLTRVMVRVKFRVRVRLKLKVRVSLSHICRSEPMPFCISNDIRVLRISFFFYLFGFTPYIGQ